MPQHLDQLIISLLYAITVQSCPVAPGALCIWSAVLWLQLDTSVAVLAYT